MRKILAFTVVFVLTSLSASAVEITIGAVGSFSSSRIVGQPIDGFFGSDARREARSTFSPGGFLNVALSETISLRTSIRYAEKGQDVLLAINAQNELGEMLETPEVERLDYEFEYVDVVTAIRFLPSTLAFNGIQPYFSGGLLLSFFSSGIARQDPFTPLTVEESGSKPEVGFALGTGIQVNVGKLRPEFGIEYLRSLSGWAIDAVEEFPDKHETLQIYGGIGLTL